jgi:hypothetical protein
MHLLPIVDRTRTFVEWSVAFDGRTPPVCCPQPNQGQQGRNVQISHHTAAAATSLGWCNSHCCFHINRDLRRCRYTALIVSYGVGKRVLTGISSRGRVGDGTISDDGDRAVCGVARDADARRIE